MTTRSKRDLDNARAALADTRTPADVAIDATAEKLGAALGKAAIGADLSASYASPPDHLWDMDGEREVCQFNGKLPWREHQAYADLFVAAPAMLAALKMIVRGYELVPVPGMETDIAAARAAIARAEGGGK